MMACGSRNHQRSGNRIYEWLRKQHSVAMSISQTGNGNSQFGKVWIFNLGQQENKKIKISELLVYLNNGWEKGRVHDFNNTHYTCEVCQTKFRSPLKKKPVVTTASLHSKENLKRLLEGKKNLKPITPKQKV
jgi:hypothetical protein